VIDHPRQELGKNPAPGFSASRIITATRNLFELFANSTAAMFGQAGFPSITMTGAPATGDQRLAHFLHAWALPLAHQPLYEGGWCSNEE